MGMIALQEDTINHRVERLAIRALCAQKVPFSFVVGCFTINTGNVDNAGQFSWYGLHFDTGSHCVPGRHHSVLCFRCLFANRASAVVDSQLPKALPVNCVATGHFM